MRSPILFSAILAAALAMGCSPAENVNSTAKASVAPSPPRTPEAAASPATPPSGTLPVSQVKSLPPEGGDIPTKAEFDGYKYSYKTEATKTVATFSGKLLPSDRDIMFGAVRDVIARSYGDKVDSSPRLTGSGAGQSLRIAGKRHEYVVVPITDPNGEIRALIITQLSE